MGLADMVACSAYHWLENVSRAISPRPRRGLVHVFGTKTNWVASYEARVKQGKPLASEGAKP